MTIERASLSILGVAVILIAGAEACSPQITDSERGTSDTPSGGGGSSATSAASAGGADPGTSTSGDPSTSSSASTGAGAACPVVSGSICDGIFDGAPAASQPVWAACTLQAIALGVDADGTNVVIDYDGNVSLRDADGHEVDTAALAFATIASGHYTDWIRFSAAPGGGPSDLLVGRRYFESDDDTPKGSTVERFDRAGHKLWSYSVGSGSEALHPYPDASGNLFALANDQVDVGCSVIELDAAGNLANQAPLASYPGASCTGLAGDAAGNHYVGLSYLGAHGDHETLVKLDPSGGEAWSKTLASRSGQGNAPTTVAIGATAAGAATAVVLEQTPNAGWTMTLTRFDASAAIATKQQQPLRWNGAAFAFDGDGALFLATYLRANSHEYGVDFTSAGHNTLGVAKFESSSSNADWGVGIAAPSNADNTLDVQVDGAGNAYVWSTTSHSKSYVARLKSTPSCAP